MIFTIFIMAIILVKHFLLLFFILLFHFPLFFTFESELFWSYSANTICWFLRQSFYESWNLLWNMYQYVWMCYVDTMFLCFLLHVFFRMYEWYYLKKLKYATNYRDRVVCTKKNIICYISTKFKVPCFLFLKSLNLKLILKFGEDNQICFFSGQTLLDVRAINLNLLIFSNTNRRQRCKFCAFLTRKVSVHFPFLQFLAD